MKCAKYPQNPQIIQRDLCPDNILIKLEENNEVVVKIADFGLVTAVDNTQSNAKLCRLSPLETKPSYVFII
jgi:serine/threonine protein kinase